MLWQCLNPPIPQRFLACATEATHQAAGSTILYIPPEEALEDDAASSAGVDIVSGDRDLMQVCG